MIVKYVETSHNGIQSLSLSRYAIGYILRGEKYIYYGDKRHRLSRGDLFYLGMGHHYTEDIPEEGHPFEQIMFYYTPSELQRILLHLNITYGLNISNDHTCENCRSFNHVVTPAWNPVRSFFVHTNNYLRDEAFLRDETAENIKMTELIYLISSHEDCCIKSKLLSNIDTAKENFEQIVYDHIFRDISIEELSRLCNRSLTSFKKEFKRLFSLPPHKWYIRQRLMHSRLLLISRSPSPKSGSNVPSPTRRISSSCSRRSTASRRPPTATATSKRHASRPASRASPNRRRMPKNSPAQRKRRYRRVS